MTPAEERAQRENLPVVPMTNFDLLRVASGHPMIVSTADGGEALVRLYTADELFAVAGNHGMPRAKAVELTTPLAI